MKSLMSLWRELAHECASWCCTSATLDIQTVERRVKTEGESFFTMTLPDYCKDFERSLDSGRVDSTQFSGFRKLRGLPVFLRGYLSQVFDPSGEILDEPSIDAILSIRQLTLVFGKIERPCTPARTARAMRQFIRIEEELARYDSSRLEEFLPLFRKSSTLLWADVLADVENVLLGTEVVRLQDEWLDLPGLNPAAIAARLGSTRTVDPFMDLLQVPPDHGVISRRKGRQVFVFDENVVGEVVDPSIGYHLVPRHGPGATADRLRGNAKFSVAEWTTRLESVFPYGDYALPSWRSYDQLDRVQFLEPGAERPVKVIAVPKTLRTPRIIAVEPTCMQYMQQAVAHQLVDRLEDRVEAHPSLGAQRCDFGRYFIGFRDQEPNRFLALKGSLDGGLATLDLSEASDRVLNQHVELLFAGFPRLAEGVQATRSLKADVQGHGEIHLAKFASMGSALTFPVEAMVFTTIIIAAIAKARNSSVNRELLWSLRGKVRVYGDDIVVPVEYVRPVIDALEAFGLVVNHRKSFWTGRFRESCGGDYYAGEWVTPVRLRHDLPQSRADISGLVGLASFRNLLYWNGFWKTAAAIDERLVSLTKGHWSVVDVTAKGIGRESVLSYRTPLSTQRDRVMRLHPTLHTPLVRGIRVRETVPMSRATGTGALMKFMLKRGLQPFQDTEHLERQGRPQAVGIKLGWIRPY